MHKITAIVIAETSTVKKGKETAPPTLKSAPHYFAKSVPSQSILGGRKITVGQQTVELVLKAYEPDVVVVEASTEIKNIFDNTTLELKDKLLDLCYDSVKQQGGKEEPSEEYTVYQISEYRGDPEVFLGRYAKKIAGLLKSEKLELDENEVEHTLSYQFKYVKDDLVILDWDGAFIFEPAGEFEETIELLELANYQLLRYRILDRNLDERLARAAVLTQARRRLLRTKEVAQAFEEVIKLRSDSIFQFQAMERDIKLIGDWYSARFYDLLSRKFRLDGWRQAIREKLDSLEDVYSIVSENLGVSSQQVLELVQIGAFFVLQIGWFVLIILEFIYFTR